MSTFRGIDTPEQLAAWLGITAVHREAVASCSLDGETQCVWPERVSVDIPIKLPSLANSRLHWRAMSKLKKAQKEAVATFLCNLTPPPMPVKVAIIRYSPRQYDFDNYVGACKYVRDQIAEWMGVDDGSDKYEWVYEQRKGTIPFVRIEIERKEA